MRLILVLLLFLSFQSNLNSQTLPRGQIIEHLKLVDEIPKQSASTLIENEIHIDTLFKRLNAGMYIFYCNDIYRYNFLLLKNDNNFLILNGHDFLNEYENLCNFFNGAIDDELSVYIFRIIKLYQHNANYHPTPPYPNLKKLKDASGNVQKSIYPPRKLIVTKPFIFNGE